MKTLLKGGPLGGRIINASPTQFGYGEVTQVLKKMPNGSEKHMSAVEQVYRSNGERERHPSKKKGTVRVFAYQGPKRISEKEIRKHT